MSLALRRLVVPILGLTVLVAAGSVRAEEWSHSHVGDCVPTMVDAAETGGAILVGRNADYETCAIRILSDGAVAWQVALRPVGEGAPREVDAGPDDGACLLDQRGVVTRLAPDGEALWSIGVSRASYEVDVAATKDGGCVIAGVACLPEAPGFVARFARDGAVAWTRTLDTDTGTTVGSQGFHRVLALGNGDLLVAGQANENTWDEGRLIAVRLGPDGETVWMRELARCVQGLGTVTGLAEDADGGVLVAAMIGESWPANGRPCVTWRIMKLDGGTGEGLWQHVRPECAGPSTSLAALLDELGPSADGVSTSLTLDFTRNLVSEWGVEDGGSLGVAVTGVLDASASPDGSFFELRFGGGSQPSFRVTRRPGPAPGGRCLGGSAALRDDVAEALATTPLALDDTPTPLVILRPPVPRAVPTATAWRDDCPPSLREPSALDRFPAATPLRVAKTAGGLLVTWEDVGAESYDLYEGRISRHGFAPDGPPTCGLASPSAIATPDAPFACFLASAVAAGVQSSLGRTSFGWDRGCRLGDCR